MYYRTHSLHENVDTKQSYFIFETIFRGLTKKQLVLLTHGDSVEKVADGYKSVGTSGSLITAIANEKSHIYGLQFHPEVGFML